MARLGRHVRKCRVLPREQDVFGLDVAMHDPGKDSTSRSSAAPSRHEWLWIHAEGAYDCGESRAPANSIVGRMPERPDESHRLPSTSGSLERIERARGVAEAEVRPRDCALRMHVATAFSLELLEKRGGAIAVARRRAYVPDPE